MKYILKPKCETEQKDCVDRLSGELHVSRIFARVLCARGLATEKEAEAFLHPDKNQLNDPFLFSDMADSVSMIKNMVSRKKKICVYGDYDVDGVCGCAILVKALRSMGADADCVLPSRLQHGYGLSLAAVEQMAGFSLLITVDCGITNVEEIKAAREMGIKTIVTDHHECGPVLPAADYILNPKRPDETYPYRDLCGAAVAYKLAQALLGKEAEQYIDLAAVATVADIVPLLSENRALVKLGLEKLNSAPNKGIKALFLASGIKGDTIDSQTVAYSLAPRINAAGRIASAQTAFSLLMEEDEGKRKQFAEELCALNAQRQEKQERIVREAMEMEAKSPAEKLIFHYREDWDVGIVGLAASKLAEKYGKPAVLFGKSGESYTGSARSIDGVNIYEVLKRQAALYEKFGGHAGAAGLTLAEENLDELKTRLRRYMDERYDAACFRPVKYYDIVLAAREVTRELVGEFDLLRPFGHKNGQVEVLVKNAEITDIRAIGDDRHSRFKVSGKLNAVYFGAQSQNIPRKADVVGIVQRNAYDDLPQMVVSALSAEPTLLERYETACAYVRASAAPTGKHKYFMDREALLYVYTVVKAVSENGTRFDTVAALLEFLRRHIKNFTPEKAAYALCLLEELDLLEIEIDDKISITVYAGKRELTESEIYNKF
ncbi:MAG TPA: single-stranded-DNA-specific exonuclease RecJ, partial [Clostridiales bacterium]|nr:single-stranded-DNA-specific exonuclease RecJ [Clostridiales bacterium]